MATVRKLLFAHEGLLVALDPSISGITYVLCSPVPADSPPYAVIVNFSKLTIPLKEVIVKGAKAAGPFIGNNLWDLYDIVGSLPVDDGNESYRQLTYVLSRAAPRNPFIFCLANREMVYLAYRQGQETCLVGGAMINGVLSPVVLGGAEDNFGSAFIISSLLSLHPPSSEMSSQISK